MSCRSDHPVFHNFPPAFPLDTDYFDAAVTEFNLRTGRGLRFDQLSSLDMQAVLQRALELKKLSGAGSSSHDKGETQSLPSLDPVPEKAAAENISTRARRFVRCLVPWRRR